MSRRPPRSNRTATPFPYRRSSDLNGLDDSKQLTAARREALYARIVERALAWKIVFVEVEEIDRVNIFQATMLGMRRALEGVLPALETRSCVARIDGNHLPRPLPCPAEAWIGGDARRSEEHTSELQSLMRNSNAVFCLKKKKKQTKIRSHRVHFNKKEPIHNINEHFK